MDFIRDRLAVGSREEAESSAALMAAGISLVLSLEPTRREPGARQILLPIKDRQPIPLRTLAAAVRHIHLALAAGKGVLVHCEMGISRSPAIVAAYLVAHEGLDASAAVRLVQAARPVADPHPVLRQSLIALQSLGSDRALGWS